MDYLIRRRRNDMPKINWEELSNELKEGFKNEIGTFYDGYEYGSDNNFIYGVVARVEESFKPKVLNILIVGTNYGWKDDGNGGSEFDWSIIESAIENDKILISQHYDVFTDYQTWIYIDIHSAVEYDKEHEGAEYASQLSQTGVQLEAFCLQNANYGWRYKGLINESPIATRFKTDIRQWQMEVLKK
jgi:hypothetical protein